MLVRLDSIIEEVFFVPRLPTHPFLKLETGYFAWKLICTPALRNKKIKNKKMKYASA